MPKTSTHKSGNIGCQEAAKKLLFNILTHYISIKL